jgi:hypothetical protein
MMRFSFISSPSKLRDCNDELGDHGATHSIDSAIHLAAAPGHARFDKTADPDSAAVVWGWRSL